ncbi:hypothetical protein AVEN_12358-1 [Araneus ventricosus]|uniref:Uncharacterized protein n=1 Tax=Araneus ventricosus TaxID=182803 RepID=A0A4Y2NP64_ARAVE|nr:hypothetical protein AVEN_12358-1 [Araneus ventricosus]
MPFLRVDAVQPSCLSLIQDLIKFCHEQIKFIILKDNKKMTVTIDRQASSSFVGQYYLLINLTLWSQYHLALLQRKEALKISYAAPEKSPILTRTDQRVHFYDKYRDFVLNYRSNFFSQEGVDGVA